MSAKPNLFTGCVTDIEREYVRLGHQHGWRFLCTPRRTLAPSASIAFVTLNPGGPGVNPTHGVGSCERGSAYVHESWKACSPGEAPLQRQIRAMFDWLGFDPERTLSAYFIPFRSRSYATLVARANSYTFAVGLWRRILTDIRPSLIVCIGTPTERGLREAFGTRPIAATAYPVGWGKVKAVLTEYPDHRLLRLPHLARFAVFGRPESVEPLRVLRTAVG